MSHVVKVYTGYREPPIYFIDGWRSEFTDDTSVLHEVLGEDFEEYVLTSRATHDVESLEDLLEMVDERV